MPSVEIILYVADAARSKRFYTALFGKLPDVDVPGMTAFDLSPEVRLGLMPNDGIANIICPALPHPSRAAGIPRCELYLRRSDAREWFTRAIGAHGKKIEDFQARNWGDTAAYLADPDGHVLAFAYPTA